MIRTVLLALASLVFFLPHAAAQTAFTLEQIMSAPFPEHLTASKTGDRLYFTPTVDLVARLRAKSAEIEQLIFPDEVHDFLLQRDWLAAYQAASDFFDRHFHGPWK